MNAALFNSGISASPTDCDTLTVCLIDPSMLISHGMLSREFFRPMEILFCTFSGAYSGNSFYLRVTHRNSLETWSADPVQINDGDTYDFTTSDLQAYSSNMVNVDPGTFALWSGDVSDFGSNLGIQDGFVESSDYGAIENDSQNFAFGYNYTDITGDGLVESSDYSMIENNSQLFIIASHP